MSTNQDITLVFGKGRKKFQKVHLKAGVTQKITLKHKKFGIVTHVFENEDDAENDGKDNSVYTVERYKLPTDKEQTIVLRSEGNNTVAYLVTDLGEERLFSEVMEYRMGTSKGEEEEEQHRHLVQPTLTSDNWWTPPSPLSTGCTGSPTTKL